MDAETFVSQRPIERLDMRIVHWLSAAREVDPHAMVIGPQFDQVTGKFCTIISKQILWSTAKTDQSAEHLNDILAG